MDPENIESLKNGGVGVIPTDTVYGLACSAFNKEGLLRIYDLKGRDENKPPIILISHLTDLDLFGIQITDFEKKYLDKYWPGKVSFIFNLSKDFSFLDKGRGLAVRYPKEKKILVYLEKTGPLATSSANIQGFPPAINIKEAEKYFGSKVDFYEDGGTLNALSSTLVDLRDCQIKILRQGEVKIKPI